MNGVFGERRKRLLRHLLRNKAGASIDELAQAIEVTRTAVRQHLAALAREGLVAPGEERATGGRPQRLYVLTENGVLFRIEPAPKGTKSKSVPD